MLYQLPLHLALFLVFVDLGLLLLVLSSRKWKKWRALSRISAFLLFCGFSLFKWIGTSPTFLASSPNELIFKSNEEIGKLYFARQGNNGLFIFWEEKISGKEGKLTFEMEGIYPNGLLIFKEIDQKLLGFRPNLELDGDTWKPIQVEINEYEFELITPEEEAAWESQRKVAWANYASQALSLLFLASFLITSLNKRPKIS
jgi:hypothetical protein